MCVIQKWYSHTRFNTLSLGVRYTLLLFFIDSDVFYFVVCVCVCAGALLRPRSI